MDISIDIEDELNEILKDFINLQDDDEETVENKSSDSFLYDSFFETTVTHEISYDGCTGKKARRDNVVENMVLPIIKPLPLRTSIDFCLGISHAFNSGDVGKIVQLVHTFTLDNIVFRMQYGSQSFLSKGSDNFIGYFLMLLEKYPDGVFFVKRVDPGRDNGIRILRSKLYFSGTRIYVRRKSKKANDIENKSNDLDLNHVSTMPTQAKCFVTAYLDKSNRIAVMNDIAKPIKRSLASNFASNRSTDIRAV